MMNQYPFIIRGPTDSSRRKRVFSQGINFKNALVKVLSVFPAKFVNFKYAKTMDLITVKTKAIKLSRASKGLEHRIWLNEKEGEFYVTFINGENCTMLVEEEETDPVEIGSARLNRFKLQSIWLNGEQVKETNTTELKEKPAKAATKMEKTKTPARKAAAKKGKVKNGSAKEVPSGAKKQTITIKQMRDMNKKGYTFFTTKGVKFSQWSIDGFKQADRKIEVFVQSAA